MNPLSILLAVIFAAIVSSANAQSIGINFGSGRVDAALDPTDSAGVVPQTNWNNADGANGGPLALVDGSADATTASVAWASDEQWSIGGPGADANGTMLNGWISANDTVDPPSTVDITGIPFANYNLYIYFNHDRATEDIDLSETSGAFPDFRAQENDTDITLEVTFNEQTATAAGDDTQMGNYVKFTALTAAELHIVLSPAGAEGSTDRGAITGIQLENVTPGDADGDGLTDAWEGLHGLDPNDNGSVDPNNGPAGDPDNDGSPNLREQTQNSDPNDDDSDDDTLLDGVETGDGNFVDATMTGTSPIKADTDGDTLRDNIEDNGGSLVDPTTMTGTNPNLPDTDGDTLRDDWEIANLIDPFDNGDTDPNNGAAGDPDSDGSTNAAEQTRMTDPQDDDSDDDLLLDGVESDDGIYVDANATGTDPLDPDSDDDTLTDNVEDNSGIFASDSMTGTNPNLPDTDGDSLRDDWEINNGFSATDPSDATAADGAIGLNFGAGRDNAELGTDASAGVFPHVNWNNLAGAVGNDMALTDDTGAASGANVSWELDEEWSVAGPAIDGDGTLMTGWFSANDAGAANTLDITGIPYANYDLVVYFNHDRNGEDTLISEVNEAFPSFLARVNNPNVTAEVNLTQQVESLADNAAASGDFVVFSGLSAGTLNLLIGSDDPDNPRGPVTGMQLINRGNSEIKILSITLDEEAGSATVTWSAISGRFYSIEGSGDMTTGGWLEIQDSLLASDVTRSFTETGLDFSATPRKFYRVFEQIITPNNN